MGSQMYNLKYQVPILNFHYNTGILNLLKFYHLSKISTQIMKDPNNYNSRDDISNNLNHLNSHKNPPYIYTHHFLIVSAKHIDHKMYCSNISSIKTGIWRIYQSLINNNPLRSNIKIYWFRYKILRITIGMDYKYDHT